MTRPAGPRSLGRRLGAAFPFIAALLFLSALASGTSAGRKGEGASRDVMARVAAVVQGPRADGAVAVVLIDDADYDTLFAATSPLDVQTLQRLIDAVAQGRPAAIGVDIETSHPAFTALVPPADVPVVWARATDLVCPCRRSGGCEIRLPVSPDSLRPRYDYCPPDRRASEGVEAALDYLGGTGDGRHGAATLERDADGVIRSYSRTRATLSGDLPTFAATLARVALGQEADPLEPAGRQRFIEFRPSPDTRVWSAGQILDFARTNPEYGILRDRVVVIGGSYWAGRDRHFTPLGDMTGAEIHAQILETELAGGGAAPVNAVFFFATLTLTAYLFLMLFHFYPLWPAMRRSLPWLVVLALAGGYVAGRASLVFVPHFAFFLGAVWLQQVYAALKRLHNADLRDLVYGIARARPFAADVGSPEQLGPSLEAGMARAVRDLVGRTRGVLSFRRGRPAPARDDRP